MDVAFLGANDVGMRIYDWLCARDGVNVRCLLTTSDQLDIVGKVEPELIVSVGYDHLVPEDVLSIPPRGAVNLHPSLLPLNRGKSPNVWSIVDDTPAGVTLHYMDPEYDRGPIIAQREVETRFSDTGKHLHHRLEDAQFDLFVEAWPDVEAGDVEPEFQNPDSGTYHSVTDFVELCEIDPDAEYTARELLDVLRALTFPPFYNARVEVDGDVYYVEVEITPATETGDAEPEGLLSGY